MTDEQLNRRLRELLDGTEAAAEPRPECPTLPELLAWATGGEEPGSVAAHVQSCPHCSRRLDLFRQERAAWPGKTLGRRPRRRLIVSLSTVGLAAAACLLIAILYPSQPYARYFDAMNSAIPGAYRGEGGAEPTGAKPLPPDMVAFLKKVEPRLRDMDFRAQTIRRYLSEQKRWIEIDADGRLAATDAVPEAMMASVDTLIAQEANDREIIVRAIIQAENDAASRRGGKLLSGAETASVQRVVDRWRTKQIKQP